MLCVHVCVHVCVMEWWKDKGRELELTCRAVIPTRTQRAVPFTRSAPTFCYRRNELRVHILCWLKARSITTKSDTGCAGTDSPNLNFWQMHEGFLTAYMSKKLKGSNNFTVFAQKINCEACRVLAMLSYCLLHGWVEYSILIGQSRGCLFSHNRPMLRIFSIYQTVLPIKCQNMVKMLVRIS